MNDTTMTRKSDPKYDDDLVNKRYIDEQANEFKSLINGIDGTIDDKLNEMSTILLNLVHPIGEIFTTTSSTFNPNTSWGGTWIQLTSDAYFKIVTSNAGNLGGTSSQHKIPVNSLPAHSHELTGKKTMVPMGSSSYYCISADSSSYDAGDDSTTKNRGGGQAYYPYYYGVYAWHRTA